MRTAPFCSGASGGLGLEAFGLLCRTLLGRGLRLLACCPASLVSCLGAPFPSRQASRHRLHSQPTNSPAGHSHTSDGTIVVAGGDWANNGFLLEGRYAVRTWSKDGTAWTTRCDGRRFARGKRAGTQTNRWRLLTCRLLCLQSSCCGFLGAADAKGGRTALQYPQSQKVRRAPRSLASLPTSRRPPPPRPEGLAYPHWYPTQLTLPDDRVLAVGGYASEADPPVPAIEVWDGRVRRVTTIAPEPFLQQLGTSARRRSARGAAGLAGAGRGLGRVSVFPQLTHRIGTCTGLEPTAATCQHQCTATPRSVCPSRRPQPLPHCAAAPLDQRPRRPPVLRVRLQPGGESAAAPDGRLPGMPLLRFALAAGAPLSLAALAPAKLKPRAIIKPSGGQPPRAGNWHKPNTQPQPPHPPSA
jgi:hypothetical protein